MKMNNNSKFTKKKIINFFKQKKYKGNFILQTARNKQNFHIHEINLNRDYILQL